MRLWAFVQRAPKALEQLGRGALMRLAVRLWRAPPRAVAWPAGRPLRLLVIRLDPRLGNVLMTTPLLVALRERFADAAIDCLVSPYAARVLRDHPAGVRLLPFRRWSWLAAMGPWRRMRALRRQAYDVCIDAANPTHPSVTQALMARAAGARTTIGYDVSPVASLYNVRVPVPAGSGEAHEIDRRLWLLDPLGIRAGARVPSVGPLAASASPHMAAFVEHLRGAAYVVINLGARASARRVSPADGATVANLCKSLGFRPVLVCGIGEQSLCDAVRHLSLDVLQAPDANLADLAMLCTHAAAFVSGDTGPMHLAVALGCPTLGIFSATPPARYGYAQSPHGCIDARAMDSMQWASHVRAFLAQRRHDTLVSTPPRESAAAMPWRARSGAVPRSAARIAHFARQDSRA